jgi:hypothetical protein
MKKLTCTALLSLVVMVALTMASCGKKAADYRNALPADAFMTLSINPRSLADKAAVGDFTQSSFYRLAEKAIGEGNDLEDADRQLLLSMLADPAKSGLSMEHDIFLSTKFEGSQYSPEPTIMMVAKVGNRGDVDVVMERAEQKSEGKFKRLNEGGITRLVSEMGEARESAGVAYDDNMLVCYFAPKVFSAEEVKAMFAADKTKSVMGLQHAAAAFDARNDMCMVMSMSGIADMAQQEMPTPMMEMMKSAYYVAPANFEKGRVVSTFKTYFTDADLEKKYLDFSAKISGEVKGDLAKYLPANSLLAVVGNLHGTALYEFMAETPSYSGILQMVPQIKTMMEAIDGDMVLALTGLELGTGRNEVYPRFAVLAEMSNPGAIAGLEPVLPQMGFTQTSPGQWAINTGKMVVNLGVHQNILYATNDAAVVSVLAGGQIESIADRYGNLIKGGYGMFTGDFRAASESIAAAIAAGVLDDDVAQALPVIDMFDNLVVASTADKTSGEFTLNMTDKEKNAADVIYHTAEGMFGAAMGMAAATPAIEEL